MFDLTGMLAVSAPFLMVIGIVWVRSKARIEEKRIAAGATAAPDLTAKQNAKIELLEDRIAVLERIVTDRGYGLASEIEALRDARPDNGVPLEIGRQQERQR